MVNVAIIGASGGVGQPLALLLKLHPLVTELRLYSLTKSPGVAVDLSHISTAAKVDGYLPDDDGLSVTLKDAEVVIIAAGAPFKSQPNRDAFFKLNASVIKDLATAIAISAPKALILLITNPVNSLVPVVAEVLKKHGCFDPKRLFGVTTLDMMRASTFLAEAIGKPSLSKDITVPVLGGHTPETTIPLLSQSSHPLPSYVDRVALVKRIKYGGREVVDAKKNTGAATLSMAYAGFLFISQILGALNGEKGLTTFSYVNLMADPDGAASLENEIGEKVAYFASHIEIGKEGVVKILSPGRLTDDEVALVKVAIPELVKNIKTGVEFGKEESP